jgi:hypothetical protein
MPKTNAPEVEAAPAIGQAIGLVTFSSASVVAVVLTAEANSKGVFTAPLEVAAVLIKQARFAVFANAPLVTTVVPTAQARFAVFATAALEDTEVLIEQARFAVFATVALVVAVVETLPFPATPRITCAEVVTAQAPATLRFLLRVALAVTFAAPVIEPASDNPNERDAVVVALQLTDAAKDCDTPKLPFKAAALRAERLSSIRSPAN